MERRAFLRAGLGGSTVAGMTTLCGCSGLLGDTSPSSGDASDFVDWGHAPGAFTGYPGYIISMVGARATFANRSALDPGYVENVRDEIGWTSRWFDLDPEAIHRYVRTPVTRVCTGEFDSTSVGQAVVDEGGERVGTAGRFTVYDANFLTFGVASDAVIRVDEEGEIRASEASSGDGPTMREALESIVAVRNGERDGYVEAYPGVGVVAENMSGDLRRVIRCTGPDGGRQLNPVGEFENLVADGTSGWRSGEQLKKEWVLAFESPDAVPADFVERSFTEMYTNRHGLADVSVRTSGRVAIVTGTVQPGAFAP